VAVAQPPIDRATAAIAIELVPREPPLEAVAAVALGAAACALGRRLLAGSDEQLAELRGLTGMTGMTGLAGMTGATRAPLLAVLGDVAALPWVDGIVYLGRDAEAPRLLLPTTLRPSVTAALFEAAVLRHLGLEASRAPSRSSRPPSPSASPSPSPSPSARAAAPSPPFAVLGEGARLRHLFSLASARPIQRAPLEQWLAQAREAAP
jgi:hypothetical protein